MEPRFKVGDKVIISYRLHEYNPEDFGIELDHAHEMSNLVGCTGYISEVVKPKIHYNKNSPQELRYLQDGYSYRIKMDSYPIHAILIDWSWSSDTFDLISEDSEEPSEKSFKEISEEVGKAIAAVRSDVQMQITPVEVHIKDEGKVKLNFSI